MTWAGPLWKPEKHTRVKGRRKRAEQKRVKSVRTLVVARDGTCIAEGLSPCRGKSEWAHHAERQRSKTTGAKNVPEYRHSTTYSFMACTGHHYQYDTGHTLTVDALDPERVCDGHLVVTDLVTGQTKVRAPRTS